MRIDPLKLAEILDYHQRLLDDLGISLHGLQFPHWSAHTASDGRHPYGAPKIELKLSCQSRIDNGKLAARIHDEVERALAIHFHRNDYEGVLDKTGGYTCGISRAMRLCMGRELCKQDQAERK